MVHCCSYRLTCLPAHLRMSVWLSVHTTPIDMFCLPACLHVCPSVCLSFSLFSIICMHVKAVQLCGQGRPGAGLSPVSLRQLEMDLKDKHGKNSITYRDVMSSAMYPQVFDEFK